MARIMITVTLYMSELLYDVKNKTYLTGKSRAAGDNYENVANMQANDDDENANQLIRSIGNSFGILKTKLSEYLTSDAVASNNAQINSSDNLVLSLSMPGNYNKATEDTVASSAHQFIVNNTIAGWFTITNKADAGDYLAMSEINIKELREALNKRVSPSYTSPIGGGMNTEQVAPGE